MIIARQYNTVSGAIHATQIFDEHELCVVSIFEEQNWFWVIGQGQNIDYDAIDAAIAEKNKVATITEDHDEEESASDL